MAVRSTELARLMKGGAVCIEPGMEMQRTGLCIVLLGVRFNRFDL